MVMSKLKKAMNNTPTVTMFACKELISNQCLGKSFAGSYLMLRCVIYRTHGYTTSCVNKTLVISASNVNH